MTQTNDVEAILVGNELLKGERRDAHLSFIGQALMPIGVRVGGAHVIGDNREQIARLIGDRMDDTRVLIVSGGLGPTHDDITREGVADAIGQPLVFDDSEWKVVQNIFKRFGHEADESNKRQAYFPKGATPIANPNGTAAGFFAETNDNLIAVLPGPPKELVPMMQKDVVPRIDALFKRPPLIRRTFRTAGVGESTMTPHVKPIFDAHEDVFDIASLPHAGGVDLIITQKTTISDKTLVEQKARSFEDKLRDYLGVRLYASEEIPFEEIIGEVLVKQNATLAIAESLTGGLLGKRFTDLAGCSRFFLADVVAYSDESKQKFLSVKEQTLKEHGAVSEAVCLEMADGMRKSTGASYALATTGIAGPDGGTKEKPVGLTYYGLCWDGGSEIRHRIFPGARQTMRERVCYATMLLLHEHLNKS